MLESQGLLILPWAATDRPPPGQVPERTLAPLTRSVRNAHSGALLGHVWWWPGSPRSWLAWLACPALEVFETDDDSLLFTAQRAWGLSPRWQVRDADDRSVGWAEPGATVRDIQGRAVARFEGPVAGRFVGPRGDELAGLEREGEATVLTFAGQWEDNPFLRMLLLAAALAAEPPPG